jgi:hypothetical protein
MKVKYLISMMLFLWIFSKATAQQHEHTAMSSDKPSVHGMLIFGMDKIYASHLPMFRTPHDYQIILELELDKANLKLFIKDQKEHPEYTTYTIEPERFVLPDMIQNPKPFKVNLYRGHFERGGVKIMTNATVKIKQVVCFRKFNKDEAKSTTTDFLLFGNEGEHFMAHFIINKPDFEQIIQVKIEPSTFVRQEKFAKIILDATGNTPIGVSSNTVSIDDNGKKQPLTLLKQIYLEFDDLKE